MSTLDVAITGNEGFGPIYRRGHRGGAAGQQEIFIENGRLHGAKIVTQIAHQS